MDGRPDSPGEATELSIHFADTVEHFDTRGGWLFVEGLHLVAGGRSVAGRLLARIARTAGQTDVTRVDALGRTAVPRRTVATLRDVVEWVQR